MTTSTTTARTSLPPNVIEHFYRGGERIAALRGHRRTVGVRTDRSGDPRSGSARRSTRWGTDGSGLTDLGALGPLHELVAADPQTWLGAAHVARWGSSPALLVKLLDAGERLPVHVHPDRRFAADPPRLPVRQDRGLGRARRPVRRWHGVRRDDPPGPPRGVGRARRRPGGGRDARAAPSATVDVGDGVLVPASTPHCIDAGVFVVELQEPTDFSVLLEWDGFDIDGPADGHLGLGFDVGPRRRAHRRRRQPPTSTASSGGRQPPATARRRVRCCRRASPTRTSGPGPSTPPPTPSPCRRRSPSSSSPTAPARCAGPVAARRSPRGDALVVPHAAGPLTFDGGVVSAVVAQPPSPDAPEPVEGAAP